jgi:hypothetical protein
MLPIAKNNLSRYSAVQHSPQAPEPHLPQSVREALMNCKALVASIVLASSLFATSEALAKPELTPEQLAKAKETAQQMKPPVDFDALLQEAERLGVECEGDLTRKGKIRVCANYVEIAQSDERIKASKERQAKLDEENKAIRKEIKQTLDEIKQIASQKLLSK